jgi:hypothetical protein
MLEQDDHFRHLHENPAYIRPEDWQAVDGLIDWLTDKNKSGYQIVNSVSRLQQMKAFMRMSSGLDLRKVGWYGAGTGTESDGDELLGKMPGIMRDEDGGLRFTDWNCRAGQNNVIVRTDGTVDLASPCIRQLMTGHYRSREV